MRLFLFSLTAILLGLLIGYADSRADEVQPAVMLILIFTFVFGFLQSRLAWWWAILIGSGIFSSYVIRLALGVTPPFSPQPNAFAALIALIPAFIGAYTGVAARWLVFEFRSQGTRS